MCSAITLTHNLHLHPHSIPSRDRSLQIRMHEFLFHFIQRVRLNARPASNKSEERINGEVSAYLMAFINRFIKCTLCIVTSVPPTDSSALNK